MKKILAVLSLLMFLSVSQVMAIGLPSNAYTQRHLPQPSSKHLVNDQAKKYTLISEAKSTYAAEEKSTLDSETDLHEFSKAIMDKIAGFVSMIILSLSSFGSSVADELHVVHTWIITDFPPQT